MTDWWSKDFCCDDMGRSVDKDIKFINLHENKPCFKKYGSIRYLRYCPWCGVKLE